MKTTLQIILLVTTVLGLAARAGASDRWETLRAIHWVENPNNRTTYGPKGELGPYQFRRDTWRLHTRKPFAMANDRATADQVAVMHYEWIKRGLEEAGIAPTTYNIAMAWNCGLGAVVNGRVPSVTYQYANQVTSLVESFKRQQLAQEAEENAAAEEVQVVPAVAPKFTIESQPVRLVIAGSNPMFVLDEPEADAAVVPVVKTEVAAEPERIFVVNTATMAPKPAAPHFVIATLD